MSTSSSSARGAAPRRAASAPTSCAAPTAASSGSASAGDSTGISNDAADRLPETDKQRSNAMPRQSVVLAALVLAALFAVARATPTVAQPAPPLQWGPCDDIPGEMQCAGIQVPVDYARPGGATFTLRIGRLPNTDPARKRGSLLII